MKPIVLFAALSSALSACVTTPLPTQAPPLVAMEEPTELLDTSGLEASEPSVARGSFTGLEVGDSRTSLDALAGEPEGVLVTAVIENSPADAAGIAVGDLIVEVSAPVPTVLHWPSEWRRLEEETEPQQELRLLIDRAGAELERKLVTTRRVRPHDAIEIERWREEQRVGVVVRTATSSEAARAALGAGAGAVIVGMTRESPWRPVGLRYGDLVRAVGGVEVAHPQVLLEAIRTAPEKSSLELEVVRDGQVISVTAPLSRRDTELKEISIPLLYSMEKARDRKTVSVLLGLVKYESTPAAWKLRLLWLIDFAGGDADRLESVDS